MINRSKLGAVAVMALLTLSACSTVSKVGSLNPFHGRDKEKGKASAAARTNRIPVIALNDQLKVADALKGQDFFLPAPATPASSRKQPAANAT